MPIRWVFVRDRSGTHRDEFFYTTDVRMGVERIIGLYTGRWNIETTFQEMHCCLGLETTRGWSRSTVLRTAPCLFGCTRWWRCCTPSWLRTQVLAIHWPGKVDVTFSDALSAVRRRSGRSGFFHTRMATEQWKSSRPRSKACTIT